MTKLIFFQIVMSNPKASNPEALVYLEQRTGALGEAAELVKHYRAQYPGCFVGVKYPC